MRVIKSGVIAGIAGIAVSIAGIFFIAYLSREYPASFFMYVSLAIELLYIAFPGVLAGILSSREITSKKDSIVPGLVAGAIVAAADMLLMLVMIISMGGYGMSAVQDGPALFWIGFMARCALSIVLSGLCSALAVFLTRELYWSIPSPDRERDPHDLKEVYDTLWADARTMVLDMNRSIRVYLFVGILIILCGMAILANGVDRWQHASTIGANAFSYFLALFEVAGGLIQFILGAYLLYWYDKLKKRYSRLMQMEKTLGA
jgi:hypothetical protein